MRPTGDGNAPAGATGTGDAGERARLGAVFVGTEAAGRILVRPAARRANAAHAPANDPGV